MLILPTIHRPESLRRFVVNYKKTGGLLPVFVVFDENDATNYQHIELPLHFRKCTVPAGMRLGDIFNLIFKSFPDEEFYGMVADDVVPETYAWDMELKRACEPDKIAWGWDGIQNEKLPVHPFIGGELVRKLGFWAAPGIKHWYVDNAWKDIADSLGCGVYMPEVRMKHCHYANGLAQRDRTYETQPNPIEDEITYRKWREQDLPAIVKRIS